MVKPFYVIALFVTMVTSFAVLWNINLSIIPKSSFLSVKVQLLHASKSKLSSGFSFLS